MIAAATEPLLGILKYVLLALLYLFFARVLWAVWSEVRGPRGGVAVPQTAHAGVAPSDPTVAAPSPNAPGVSRASAPYARPKGRRGNVGRFVVIEPKAARGSAFAIGDEITIGRAATCTIGIPDDTSSRSCTPASIATPARRWSRISARPTAPTSTASG